MPFLEIKGVSKSYGQVYALRDVDFNVETGEIVGLLGDNGAGKSTLIKIISGVHRSDSGEIRVHGRPMEQWSVPVARSNGVETVFQDQALAPQQSISRNIFMGRERVGFLGLTKRGHQYRESERLMREIGFTSRLLTPNSIVGTLSGGERQGVAIARALYFKASLIILDEPTTALSLTESEKVFRFMHRIREDGSSCIFITHNPYHAFDIADRFVVLDRGRVAYATARSQITIDQLTRKLQEIAKSGTDGHDVPPAGQKAGGQ